MNLIKAMLLCLNIKMMREIGGNNFYITDSPDSKIFIVGIDDTICKTVEDNYKNVYTFEYLKCRFYML